MRITAHGMSRPAEAMIARAFTTYSLASPRPLSLDAKRSGPSRVLFHGDREAYKAALNEYLAERSGTANGADTAVPGDDGQEAE